MPPIAELTITEYKHDYALFDDGARTSWSTHMVCTCVLAQRQDRAKNCCKHIVYLIRERKDKILTDKYIYVPVMLPGGTQQDDVCWASIRVDEHSGLWVQLNSLEHTFVSQVSFQPCRLDVRTLIVPHLLGLVHQVRCSKCGEEPGTVINQPPVITRLFADRNNQDLQSEALREVCHWMENPNLSLCRDHDDTDLVPF